MSAPLSPRRRLVLIIGVPAVLVAIVWAALVVADFLYPTSTTHRQFTVDPTVQRLTVEVSAADVTVRPVSGDEVRVSRTVESGWRDPSFEERSGPDGVVIQADCPVLFTVQCEIDYEIAVPDGFTVDLQASSGSLTVRRITADRLSLEVSSGDIRISDTRGPVTAEASSGDLELRNVAGSVHLEVTSGDVRALGLQSATAVGSASSGDLNLAFSTAPRKVTVSVTSGDVELALPAGRGPYRVHTSTTSGQTQVEVPTASTSSRTIDAQATSGDIEIVAR